MENSGYPFEFYGGDNNMYGFTTEKEVVYFVKFAPSNYLFERVEDYDINAFEMVIAMADNPNGEKVPADVNIHHTVMAIFNHFFDNHEKVIVFVCDSFDRRHLARARKFTAWFYKALKQASTELAKLDRSIEEENGDIILLSMFIHRRHPHRGAVVDAFFSMGTDDK